MVTPKENPEAFNHSDLLLSRPVFRSGCINITPRNEKEKIRMVEFEKLFLDTQLITRRPLQYFCAHSFIVRHMRGVSPPM